MKDQPQGADKKAARLRRQRLVQQFFERAHVSMWACDHDLRVVLWNKGAEDIYGRTAEEMLGQVYFDTFVDEAEREDSIEDTLAVMDKGQVYRNFLAYDQGSDGKTRYMLTNCFRIIDPSTGERFQAEIGIEISDLELRKDEHRTLRELGIARQAELRLAFTRERDELAYRVQRLSHELEYLHTTISSQLESFRSSSSARNRGQIEAEYARLTSALNAEYRLVSMEVENLRLRALSASTPADLQAVAEALGSDVLSWTERLRRTQRST